MIWAKTCEGTFNLKFYPPSFSKILMKIYKTPCIHTRGYVHSNSVK